MVTTAVAVFMTPAFNLDIAMFVEPKIVTGVVVLFTVTVTPALSVVLSAVFVATGAVSEARSVAVVVSQVTDQPPASSLSDQGVGRPRCSATCVTPWSSDASAVMVTSPATVLVGAVMETVGGVSTAKAAEGNERGLIDVAIAVGNVAPTVPRSRAVEVIAVRISALVRLGLSSRAAPPPRLRGVAIDVPSQAS